MKLPNFSQHEGLLHLRQQMDARRMGHFVLFDASRHLTGKERVQLAQKGVRINRDQLRVLPDHTLAIKNGRVLVYTEPNLQDTDEASLRRPQRYFHLAACPVLMQGEPMALIASTAMRSPFPLPDQDQGVALKVCPECLQQLRYKGFSLIRNRKISYSEQLLANFSLEEFYRFYTQYPVRLDGVRNG